MPYESVVRVRAGGAAGAAGRGCRRRLVVKVGKGMSLESRCPLKVGEVAADGVTVAEDAPDDEDPALDEADAAGRRLTAIYHLRREARRRADENSRARVPPK